MLTRKGFHSLLKLRVGCFVLGVHLSRNSPERLAPFDDVSMAGMVFVAISERFNQILTLGNKIGVEPAVSPKVGKQF